MTPPRSMSPTSTTGTSAASAKPILAMSPARRLISAGLPAPSTRTRSAAVGEPRERSEHRRQQARRQPAILAGRGAAPDPAIEHDLRAALRLRLQQHRVHVGQGLDAAGARLQRLRPADLAAIGGYRGVVRHVLRLERPHLQPAPGKGARHPGQQQRLADIRPGPLQHQRQRGQNSMPCWALTPPRNGCLTRVISVTRSAAAISSGLALRPVTMMCRSRGFAFSAATTSSSGR